MGQRCGADVDALDDLARTIDAEAARVESSGQLLTRRLERSWWTGSAARRFRLDWNTTHHPGLLASASFLAEAARTLRLNANQQRAASAGSNDAGHRQILTIDDAPGDERIVEVYGSLASADRVLIHIPGMNTDLADYSSPGGHRDARSLLDAARRQHGPDVAVVSFADYNVPDDLFEAASDAGARSGVTPLLALVDQLAREGHAAETVSVVAHSYGTVVVGAALRAGLDVGRVVVLGSPGMGADNRAGLGSPGVEVFAASAPVSVASAGAGVVVGTVIGGLLAPPLGVVGAVAASGLGGLVDGVIDPVSRAPVHGLDPTAGRFGARTFDVSDAAGHGGYFTPGSSSLDSIVAVALGAASAA